MKDGERKIEVRIKERPRTALENGLDEYRGTNKGLYVLLSRTQAGPGRTVKQEQEDISRNHVRTFIFRSGYSAERI